MIDIKLQLPDGFLNEEERCGYKITSKMKEVWAVQLDLLVEFDRVCKKHNIKYFASGGTMLGAVRHKGYIPWDDDIDLMMFRSDYNKLCEIASNEFEAPYFFQTEYTDNGSLRGHAQLRNSLTTAILKTEYKKKYRFNQGIFIDIFPLDAVTDDKVAFNNQYKQAMKYKKIMHRCASITTRYSVPEKNNIKSIIKSVLHKTVGGFVCSCFSPTKYYKLFEEECQRYNSQNTKLISTLSFQFNNKQHFKYREDYMELIDVPFEFISIPIGKNYDHALKERYGNYKEFVVGTSCHGDVILDVDIPYTEYLK
ncbi:MAG: LicD family protein [Ruminococcus sp.]|nr:LicD family protein [Ruminococcus sp.]